MKRKYLIIATITLAVLILASCIPAIVSSLLVAQSQSLAKSNQNTVMSEYQPICPKESYTKITELHEEGLSEDEIAEELAFPLDIVNRYLEGNFTPPPCPESNQSISPSDCPTYSKIKDLYGEGWSEEKIAKTLELPLDVVRGFISGDYTIISSCPEPYQKSEKNASSSDLHGKHEVTDEQSENSSRFVVLGETQSGIYRATVTTVTPNEDELLGKYETGDKQFKRMEIGNMIVYGHQRKIDNATVEGDYINYQFDKDTKELKKKIVHWRDDLPEHLPQVIPKEEAESMVRGGVQFTKLYFISPNSFAHPIKPSPKNPCWVVRSIDENENMIVTIVDSVEGKILGYGVPPPYGAFSLSGPQEFLPCSGAWTDFYQNAASWFNTMGYPTEDMEWPSWEKIKSHIQSYETAMFYEIAHSKDSQCFKSGCQFGQLPWLTCWGDIQTAMYDYTKMPFTFIGSCCGHCDMGENTLSYAFRKGSMDDTATVGYCHMNSDACSDCWNHSLAWQDAMFNYMNQGWTVKGAFDQAVADYHPMCDDCVRFAGDTNFKVVPVVNRTECVAESAVRQAGVPDPDEVLNPLRKLRDDHLKDEYVDRYYEYSPDLTEAMAKDPALAYEAARLLVKYSPMVTHYVSGISEETLITRKDVEEIVSFTDGLKRSVSEIKDEIGVERSQEIVEFLDEFKEQVKAFEGKTFSEALQGSIYYEDKQMPDLVKRT